MLEDELGATALDFTAVDGGPDGAAGGAQRLEQRLEGRRGAAFRVFFDPASGTCAMELWAQGSGPGQTAHRTIGLPAPGDPDAALNGSIEAAEAVFAGLLELNLIAEEELRRARHLEEDREAADAGTPPAAEGGDVGATAAAQELPDAGAEPAAEPEDRKLGLGLGLGVVWSPGDVPPRGAIRVAFDARFVPWLALRLDAWFTVIGEDLKGANAQATFDAATFRLNAFYEIVRRGPVRPALGICGGGVAVWTTGVGAGEYVGDQETAVAGYVGGTGRVGFVFNRWVRAEIGAAVGALMPEVHVRFAGESVAAFGRPLVEAFAQVELSFY
jgi:hypothetical protein